MLKRRLANSPIVDVAVLSIQAVSLSVIANVSIRSAGAAFAERVVVVVASVVHPLQKSLTLGEAACVVPHHLPLARTMTVDVAAVAVLVVAPASKPVEEAEEAKEEGMAVFVAPPLIQTMKVGVVVCAVYPLLL